MLPIGHPQHRYCAKHTDETCLLARTAGIQVQHLHREVRCRECRDLADIVGRRYLDNIHADHIDARESSQDSHRLVTAQAAANRRAGAGRVATRRIL